MASHSVSMMEWQILDRGASSAAQNMETDAKLLKELSCPILHFYEWQGASATYGHFIDPFQHLKKEGVEKMGLTLAKRPTGGGIIFHLWDFTFSILIPTFSRNTLDNYAAINSRVVSILKKMGGAGSLPSLLKKQTGSTPFCMAAPTIYDVMWEGRKIGGAAQRCTKTGLLHQGSIALLPPEKEYLLKILKEERDVENIVKMSAPLLPLIQMEIREAKQKLKQLFCEEFHKWN